MSRRLCDIVIKQTRQHPADLATTTLPAALAGRAGPQDTTEDKTMTYPTMIEALEMAAKFFAECKAAVEIEYRVMASDGSLHDTWIGRDGLAYHSPRFSN